MKKIPMAARYLVALLSAVVFLWIAVNTMMQSRLSMPGVSTWTRLGFIITGLPGSSVPTCSEEIHNQYITNGPDGKPYPTWHPVYDDQHHCVFDHEHGSDPHSYTSFASSGLPAFGYTAAQAGLSEAHAGYKVYISNNDLLQHAWMITAHQDTSNPLRSVEQFHTLDWHISRTSGEPLVSIHILADYGSSHSNCQPDLLLHPADTATSYQVSQHRAILTTSCALTNPYESWVAAVNVAGVFEASPLLDVQNPITAVEPANPQSIHPTCAYRPEDERCELPGVLGQAPWRGNRRGVLHPGQYVHNPGKEYFYTDTYGVPTEAGSPGAIQQFVTSQGWDSRDCCGEDVVFFIQTWSSGLYIPSPGEPAGSAEFWYR